MDGAAGGGALQGLLSFLALPVPPWGSLPGGAPTPSSHQAPHRPGWWQGQGFPGPPGPPPRPPPPPPPPGPELAREDPKRDLGTISTRPRVALTEGKPCAWSFLGLRMLFPEEPGSRGLAGGLRWGQQGSLCRAWVTSGPGAAMALWELGRQEDLRLEGEEGGDQTTKGPRAPLQIQTRF